jgi:hypothetical protein
MEDTTQHQPLEEADLLDAIEAVVRMTDKAYGYQHLATIGSYLHTTYPGFAPKQYGAKKLLDIVERYPERFRVKRSGSHVWVRLAAEPKRKEGYADPIKKKQPPTEKPRLMTVQEYERLELWLHQKGVLDSCDGSMRRTRQWLRRRSFLSVKGNIKRLKESGGHCDCEVIYNVSHRWDVD